MAKTISTHHNWPDIHDEGRVKRYGLFIATAILCIITALFLVWAVYTGRQNQFGPGGPSAPAQTRPS